MKIVIPSHRRPKRVITTKIVPSAVIVCREFEVDEYRRWNKSNEIVGIPESAKVENLATTRQWIHDRFTSEGEAVWMIDDDISSIRTLHRLKCRDLTPDEIVGVFENIIQMLEDMGGYLGGILTSGDPLASQPMRPFGLTGTVSSMCFGMRPGSRIRFDPRADLSEDTFMSCLNAYHHRMIFVDRRFGCVAKDSWVGIGGCATYRTMDRERKNFEFLKMMFGDVIKVRGDTHAWARDIVVPF